MERAEKNSRARVAETTKGGVETCDACNAGRAGAHRPSEALHATRSSDVLTRIAWERVPTAPQVPKRVDRGPARAAAARQMAPDRSYLSAVRQYRDTVDLDQNFD